MKRPLLALTALIMILTGLLAGQTLTAQEPAPPLPLDHREEDICGGLDRPNLLQNPSFEQGFSDYIPPGGHQDCPSGICDTVHIAHGWTPYWLSRLEINDDDYAMPEYKEALDIWVPPRTHDGARAQQYFTFFKLHEAGFYQRVAVTPGALYCFGIWGHAWTSNNDDPAVSESNLEQRIGIDPTGGVDWRSSAIVWGSPRQYYNESETESAFGPFTLVVRAEEPYLTVYTWSRPVWTVQHNDVYWDSAMLIRAPVEPAMSLSTRAVTAVAWPGGPQTHQRNIDISFLQDPGVIWRASPDQGNTLDVTLPSLAGTAARPLTIAFDSTGYAPGVYTASVTVVSDPVVPGSPATVDLTLHVLGEAFENNAYAPLFRR